jgi:hypothetical protein
LPGFGGEFAFSQGPQNSERFEFGRTHGYRNILAGSGVGFAAFVDKYQSQRCAHDRAHQALGVFVIGLFARVIAASFAEAFQVGGALREGFCVV